MGSEEEDDAISIESRMRGDYVSASHFAVSDFKTCELPRRINLSSGWMSAVQIAYFDPLDGSSNIDCAVSVGTGSQTLLPGIIPTRLTTSVHRNHLWYLQGRQGFQGIAFGTCCSHYN